MVHANLKSQNFTYTFFLIPISAVLPAGEIIALGSKSRSGGGQDASDIRSSSDWKREAPSSSSGGPPHKMAKVSGQTFTPLGRGAPESSKAGSSEHIVKPGIKTIEG